jgi:hypothetical protein
VYDIDCFFVLFLCVVSMLELLLCGCVAVGLMVNSYKPKSSIFFLKY